MASEPGKWISQIEAISLQDLLHANMVGDVPCLHGGESAIVEDGSTPRLNRGKRSEPQRTHERIWTGQNILLWILDHQGKWVGS